MAAVAVAAVAAAAVVVVMEVLAVILILPPSQEELLLTATGIVTPEIGLMRKSVQRSGSPNRSFLRSSVLL